MKERVNAYPTAMERLVYLLSPAAGEAMLEKRHARAKREAMRELGTLMATGYGNHGASTTKNSMLGWLSGGGSAEDDIDLHGAKLRERARDLDAGGGIARGATRTVRTSVVGGGLEPKPKISRTTLNMSDEQAVEWQRKTKEEFMMWAKSKTCDAARQSDFFQIQGLALLSMLISGDVFALLPFFEMPGTPYQTHIKLLEADRIGTPDSSGDSASATLPSGHRIIDGVEIDKSGMVVAYHIANRHPLAAEDNTELTYTRVEAFGKDTGMPVVLHPFEPERPEQRRGVPFVAPMIEQLKQLDRYMNSELAASIIASMFTVFFKTQADNSAFPIPDAVPEEEKVSQAEEKIELGAGAIYKLDPGVEPVAMNPMRANSSFQNYVDALCTYIGSSMEIPKEVLVKVFNSNYSASRAALLEFWRTVKMRRRWFVADFCQPVYEAWLSEAVAVGRIDAPGFFEDPLVRYAWCGVEWVGSSMGQLNPKDEAKAAQMRIDYALSTREREAAEINESDYEENIQQCRREAEDQEGLQSLAPKSGKGKRKRKGKGEEGNAEGEN